MFRHREFGIKAGLPIFSWWPTQNIKAGTSKRDMIRREMLDGSRILATLAVIDL